MLQGTGYYFYLRASNFEGTNVVKYTVGGAQVFSAIVIILTFTAGTALLMWLGEQINKRGVGNGISIILFAGIVANMPTLFTHLVNYFIDACKYRVASWRYFILAPVFLLIFLGLLWVISFMNDAERRIPIQYAKRVVGRKNVSRPKYTYSNQSWRFRCAAGYLCQLNPFNSKYHPNFLG